MFKRGPKRKQSRQMFTHHTQSHFNSIYFNTTCVQLAILSATPVFVKTQNQVILTAMKNYPSVKGGNVVNGR